MKAFGALGPGEPLRPDNNEWYVVMTKAGSEHLAFTNLQRQNFTAFLPRRWVTKRRTRGFHSALEPVFPGYLFVSLDLDIHRWRSVNGTYGVSRLVTFGDKPVPIGRDVIETFQLSTGENGALVFTEPMRPGDRVRLVSGPFADHLGVLETLDRQGRVRLLINLLSGQVRLSALRADLEPCPAPERAQQSDSMSSGGVQ